MARPYLVPCITPLKCPSGEKLYVKHVILKKDSQKQAKDANTSETRAKDVKNTLIINELFSESKAGRKRVWDKLLMVEFSSYSEVEIYGILGRGIEFNGSRYSFLGFSASQLRNKTCFLIAETDKEISDRRTKFGNFSDDIPFADRAATVQHMFEPFERSLQLAPDEFTFEYTPGIPEASGFMSPELAETIKKKLECSGIAKAPSVVQVICPGLTGGLVLSDEICAKGNENSSQPSSRIKALFKTPVATSNCGNSLTMGIVDCSKPYEVGYLDVYSVLFLEKRGVSREHLLDLQRQYYELMENLVDLTHAKYFLRLNGRQELLSRIENGITPDARETICKIKRDEIEKMQDGSKLRVLVSMSQEVFGIVDPYTALGPDECVFVPCLDGLDRQDKQRFDSAKQVLVIPQPCYTSTRIRVLKLVRDKGEYEKLKDCIVLPSQTEAPVVANKYFVCWDEKLMLQPDSSLIEKVFSGISSQISRLPVFSCFCSPEATRDKVGETVLSQKDVEADSPSTAGKLHSFQEADRPSRASKLHESGSFQDELKKYFSTFKSSEDLISRAKSHFEEFASLHGPSCSECKKLGEYLSPGFDWNARRDEVERYLSKLDTKLEKQSADPEATEESATPQPVWREMTELLDDFITNMQ